MKAQYTIFHMQKRTKPSGLSSILEAISKELGLEKGLFFHRLKKAWPTVVGQTIASHSMPEKIRFSTLTLRVDGAAWMHELSFFKGEMLQKINRKLGKGPGSQRIHGLHLKLGQLPKNKQNLATSPQHPKKLSAEERLLVQESSASISDQALKQAVKRAMEKHLLKEGLSTAGQQTLQGGLLSGD